MDSASASIAALLGSVSRGFSVKTVDDRKLIQKVVYLGQQLGLPLSYSFGWYKRGPYSPRLTRDYYTLSSYVDAGESVDAIRLNEIYRPIGERIAALLSARPDGVSEADWAELLASITFLRNDSGYDTARVRDVLVSEKAHVAKYMTDALQALQSVDLVAA